MNNPVAPPGRTWGATAILAACAAFFLSGCTSRPIVTKTIYEDRSAWIRLELNPDADDSADLPSKDRPLPSAATLAAILKGFQAEKDYNPGLLSFAMGKTSYHRVFVDQELAMLAPKLAKGLAEASPTERVAYCLTADYSAHERFITTGWVYIKPPHLYFKLIEWRTPVRVKSATAPTSEACLTKPAPGVKTADRFFKLDYEPKKFLETFGPMGASIMNKRGEVVFRLASLIRDPILDTAQPPAEPIPTEAPPAAGSPPPGSPAPRDPAGESPRPVRPSGGTSPTGR